MVIMLLLLLSPIQQVIHFVRHYQDMIPCSEFGQFPPISYPHCGSSRILVGRNQINHAGCDPTTFDQLLFQHVYIHTTSTTTVMSSTRTGTAVVAHGQTLNGQAVALHNGRHQVVCWSFGVYNVSWGRGDRRQEFNGVTDTARHEERVVSVLVLDIAHIAEIVSGTLTFQKGPDLLQELWFSFILAVIESAFEYG
jgi:hypothetical protein